MKTEHEIKRLDSTKVIFILKGILIEQSQESLSVCFAY